MNRLLLIFSAIIIFQSCKNKPQKNRITKEKTTINVEKLKVEVKKYKSKLRLNEELLLQKRYTDTVTYVNFDDNGDYLLFIVKKIKIRLRLFPKKKLQNLCKETSWKFNGN